MIVSREPKFKSKSFLSWGHRESDGALGAFVYDKQGAEIGVVSEVYCSPVDLHAQYYEIIPYFGPGDRVLLYPFDRATWRRDGNIQIDAVWEDIDFHDPGETFIAADDEYTELISYDDALSRANHQGRRSLASCA